MAITGVVWFKRDQRLHDHAPLLAATQRGPLLALHISEPSLLACDLFDASHADFIEPSLADLAASLAQRGGQLVRRFGDAVAVLQALHQAAACTQLWCHDETSQRLSRGRDHQHPAHLLRHSTSPGARPGRPFHTPLGACAGPGAGGVCAPALAHARCIAAAQRLPRRCNARCGMRAIPDPARCGPCDNPDCAASQRVRQTGPAGPTQSGATA